MRRPHYRAPPGSIHRNRISPQPNAPRLLSKTFQPRCLKVIDTFRSLLPGMVSATPSTDRSSVNGVEVKGVLFKNNAIDMAGNLYFPKDFSESRVDTDLHGGQFILIPPWPVAVPEIFTPTPSCRTSARRDRGSPKRNRACGTSPPGACIGLDHRGWRHEW